MLVRHLLPHPPQQVGRRGLRLSHCAQALGRAKNGDETDHAWIFSPRASIAMNFSTRACFVSTFFAVCTRQQKA